MQDIHFYTHYSECIYLARFEKRQIFVEKKRCLDRFPHDMRLHFVNKNERCAMRQIFFYVGFSKYHCKSNILFFKVVASFFKQSATQIFRDYSMCRCEHRFVIAKIIWIECWQKFYCQICKFLWDYRLLELRKKWDIATYCHWDNRSACLFR